MRENEERSRRWPYLPDERRFPMLRWLAEAPWLVLVVGLFPSVIVALIAVAALPPLPIGPGHARTCAAAAAESCRVSCGSTWRGQT